MSHATMVRTRRQIGRLAAVGAVALALAGAVVAPAQAQPRGAAVHAANVFIDACFSSGGDPYVYEENRVISTRCAFEDGGSVTSHEVYD